MANILVPLPSCDFDPTEAAIPWFVLRSSGHGITFSTPDGRPGTADARMLNGSGLWLLSRMLRAQDHAVETYRAMERDESFLKPIPYHDIGVDQFDAIVLPGGHAPGMKPYLESQQLQKCIVEFWAANKLVAAICHGVVLASRCQCNGKSILYGRKVTALPGWMELGAWGLTFLWLGNYYRTYPQTVQSEVMGQLVTRSDFFRGPLSFSRDGADSPNNGFTVVDQNLVTARWPGDAYRFSHEIVKKLEKSKNGF